MRYKVGTSQKVAGEEGMNRRTAARSEDSIEAKVGNDNGNASPLRKRCGAPTVLDSSRKGNN